MSAFRSVRIYVIFECRMSAPCAPCAPGLQSFPKNRDNGTFEQHIVFNAKINIFTPFDSKYASKMKVVVFCHLSYFCS